MARIPVGKTLVTVDDELFPFLSLLTWHLTPQGYAHGRVLDRMVLMHRLVANARPRYVVDHVNGNKLDNRRANLRECLQRENSRNNGFRQGRIFKGIALDPRDGKWSARMVVDGHPYSFGFSTDPAIAARAWDAAARYHYGQFARTNFAGLEARPVWELTTRSRNTKNRTSAFRGVRRTGAGRWQALFRNRHLGVFATQEEAARAYDAAAFAALGRRAALNFPEEHDQR